MFKNLFAALSLSDDEHQNSNSKQAVSGSRAAKKRLRAAQHRAEQTLLGDGGAQLNTRDAPAAPPPAAGTQQQAEAETLAPAGPASPAPGPSLYSAAPSGHCSTAGSALEGEEGPLELGGEGGGTASLCDLEEAGFYSMFMADDRHLVAMDAHGHDLFTFGVSSEAEACSPEFQQEVHRLLVALLQQRRLEQLGGGSSGGAGTAAGAGNRSGPSSSSGRGGGRRSRGGAYMSPSVPSMLSGGSAASEASDLDPAVLDALLEEGGLDPALLDALLEGGSSCPHPGGAWAAGPPCSSGPGSSSGGQGHRGMQAAAPQPDFPPLPTASAPAAAADAAVAAAASSAAAGQGRRSQGRPPARGRRGGAKRAATGSGVRVLNRAMEHWEGSAAAAAAAAAVGAAAAGAAGYGGGGSGGGGCWDGRSAHEELEQDGLRVHEDDLDLTLLLYGDDRVKQSVLSRAAQQAEREPSGPAAGPTPADMRSMMASAAGAAGGAAGSGGPPQPPPTPLPRDEFGGPEGGGVVGSGTRPGSQQGQRGAAGTMASASGRGTPEDCLQQGTGSEAEGEGEGWGAYGKKSIRKIVDEMKERGWRHVPNSGGGHQKFERVFPDLNGWKQVYFTSSSPSDVRYIWAMRADLARLDRVAAERRRELLGRGQQLGARATVEDLQGS